MVDGRYRLLTLGTGTAMLTLLTVALAQGVTKALAPEGAPGQVYYAPFPVPIVVDGATTDWAGVPRVNVDSGPYRGKDDKSSLSFAVAADDKHLYLLAEVKDASIVAKQHGLDYWNEDSVEFYLNATSKLDATTYGPGIVQLTFPAANLSSATPVLAGVNNDLWDKVTFKMVAVPGGYTLEASVPLKTPGWDIKPAAGLTLGFQAHLNAASEASKDRETKLIWSKADTADNSWQNPSLFGRLVFVKAGDTTTPPAPSR